MTAAFDSSACGVGWPRCRYKLWAGYGILITPALPPGLSSKQFHWSFPVSCEADMESYAWREIFAQGRLELWPCVLVNSLSLCCLPPSLLCTDWAQCWWFGTAHGGFGFQWPRHILLWISPTLTAVSWWGSSMYIIAAGICWQDKHSTYLYWANG